MYHQLSHCPRNIILISNSPQHNFSCINPSKLKSSIGTIYSTTIISLGTAFFQGTATALEVNWYSPSPALHCHNAHCCWGFSFSKRVTDGRPKGTPTTTVKITSTRSTSQAKVSTVTLGALGVLCLWIQMEAVLVRNHVALLALSLSSPALSSPLASLMENVAC